jgi:hypothetical protein
LTLPDGADRNRDGDVQHRIEHLHEAAAIVVLIGGIDVVV